MEKDKKTDSDSGSLNRRHFASIHKKIHNKYLQMQQRLEKSRSVDSLTTIDCDFHFNNQKEVNKEQDTDSIETRSDIQPATCTIIVEDVNRSDAIFKEVNIYESSESMIIENSIEREYLSVQTLFGEDFKTSSESLNEYYKDNEENSVPITPSRKTTIREKINNRILAAKEKRRSKEKDKDKRRESKEKDDDEKLYFDYNIFETDIDNDEKLEENYLSTPQLFNDDVKKSYESLIDDVSTESYEQLVPNTPTKVSIRDKISNKILANREKRREREKEKKRESREKIEKLVLSNSKKNKVATVTVAVINATISDSEVSAGPDEKPRLYFFRLRLGSEKRKTKAVRNNSAVVTWQELFNLNVFEDKLLEVSFWERFNFLGRATIDLSDIQKEKTHNMRLNLEDGKFNTEIFILLTISGTTDVNAFMDLDEYWDNQKKLESVWYQFRDDFTDIGWLTITAYGAKGLSANECYCVFKLANDRLQTHTESKTNNPNWMKMLTFTITDVTSILKVIIYDEKKSEVIGRVSIPLLEIQNGIAKWYALKDPSQRERAKGNNPRILLEMKFNWNLLKAAIRVINPKEINYLETEKKFDRHLFARNLSRAKIVVTWVLDSFKVIKDCFEWESRKLNLIALASWLLFCWFFKMWMVPLLIIVPFIWYTPPKFIRCHWKLYLKKDLAIEEISEKEEKSATTLTQKFQTLVEMVQTVQNFIGKVATLGERIKNLYHFKVPFLSYLAIFLILAVAFVMYLIPLQFILMGWGIHKFIRKVLRPNRVPNNEVLDLLSRVPDDETLLNCKELPVEESPEDDNNI